MVEKQHNVANQVASGGGTGTEEQVTGTSGGDAGTNGGNARLRHRPAWLAAVTFTAIGLLQLAVNVSSLIDERRALGHAIAAWRVWIWEVSSFCAWLVLIPLILSGANFARLRLKRVGSLAFHFFGMIFMSMVHSGMIVGLRVLAFQSVGDHYSLPDDWGDFLLYEFRKDVITYALVVLIYHLFLRLTAPTAVAMTNPVLPTTIEIRDGSRSTWVKVDDILWVSAAGNYVELHGTDTLWLLRRSLGEIATELAPYGFVRLHRSRLVQRAAIAKIETRQSGDFDVTLHAGNSIGGSRRYRANL